MTKTTAPSSPVPDAGPEKPAAPEPPPSCKAEKGKNMTVGEKKSPVPVVMGSLQVLQLAVTIVLAVLSFKLSERAQTNKEATEALGRQFSEKQEEFKQSISTIETDLKRKQDDRAAAESLDKLRFTLFTNVTTALEKKENLENHRLAAKALVTSLLETDDPLRVGLLQALQQGADSSTGQKLATTVQNETEYKQQEEASLALAQRLAEAAKSAQPSSTKAGDKPNVLKNYVVDVFTCEKDGTARKDQAAKIASLLGPQVAKARTRVLYETVNSGPGFHVQNLQLRYTPDEAIPADALRKLLNQVTGGLDFALRQVKKSTPNYLSVFVCN